MKIINKFKALYYNKQAKKELIRAKKNIDDILLWKANITNALNSINKEIECVMKYSNH